MTIWNDLLGTPFSVGFVDAAGVATRSLRAGNGGEPALFLHGLCGHLEAFARTIPGHAEHFDVHAIDMLGHGLTGKPDGMYTIERHAEHVLAYLDAVGIERAHVVGLSLGGWVAGWLAAHYPERVRRVSFVPPGGYPADPRALKWLHDTTVETVVQDDIELTRKRLAILMAKRDTLKDELVQVRHRLYHQPGFDQVVHRILYPVTPERQGMEELTPELLGRIEAESLVCWGREKPDGDTSAAERFAEAIPKAKLVVLDECGHWPSYERAETFTRINVAFLSKGLDAVDAGVY